MKARGSYAPPLLINLCKTYFRPLPGIDGLTAGRELLFKHAGFFEPLRKIERDCVLIQPALQLDLDFESHRHVSASAGEVLRFHQISNTVRTTGDLLQNLQRKPDRRFARAVIPN